MLTFCSEQCIYALFTDPQISFFINFFIKNGSTSLFTHLKIILLQCFQFSVFSFSKISSIQTHPLFDYFFNGFEAGFLSVFWLVYDWIFGVFLVMVVARWCGFCVMVVVVWWWLGFLIVFFLMGCGWVCGWFADWYLLGLWWV